MEEMISALAHNLELRYLRFFVVAAEMRSFTRAAERLNTVQPSLSEQIKKLEEIIGTTLFIRDKRGVELTEAGRVLLAEVRPLFERIEHAILMTRQAGRADSGRLIIGLIPGAGGEILARILPALQVKSPGTDITVKGLMSLPQLQALLEKSIDVGFLRGPVQDLNLSWEPILRHSILVALPAQHPLTSLDKIPLKALAHINFVQLVPAIEPLNQIVRRILTESGESFLMGPTVEGMQEALEVVGSGAGFSLFPSYVHSMKPPNVEIRPLDIEPQPVIDLLVAFRKDDKNPVLAKFLLLLRQKILRDGKGFTLAD